MLRPSCNKKHEVAHDKVGQILAAPRCWLLVLLLLLVSSVPSQANSSECHEETSARPSSITSARSADLSPLIGLSDSIIMEQQQKNQLASSRLARRAAWLSSRPLPVSLEASWVRARGGKENMINGGEGAASVMARTRAQQTKGSQPGEELASSSNKLARTQARKVIRTTGGQQEIGRPSLHLIDNESAPMAGLRQYEPELFGQESRSGAKSLASKAVDKLKCRVEKDLYLDFDEYRHYTCANCYNQVPPEYFTNKLALVRLEERVVKLRDKQTDELVWSNESERIRATFKDEEKFDKWRSCCHEAVACCQANAARLPHTRNALGQLVDDPSRADECPGTWDGLSCWAASPAGQLAWRICPRVAYLLDFEPACRGYVTKQCFSNASWFINRNGHEWSDYSTCSPEGLYKARMLHAAVAYVCEALIVMPALLIIGKFPNRGGNKRIRIMKSLLFYILMNSLIQALQRGFLAAGFFAEYRGSPDRHAVGGPKTAHRSQLAATATRTVNSSSFVVEEGALLNASIGLRMRRHLVAGSPLHQLPSDAEEAERALIGHIFKNVSHHSSDMTSGRQMSIIRRNVMPSPAEPTTSRPVLAEPARLGRGKRNESAWKAIFCWLLQMASRLVRLMGYAWMFTGGVYLCSALHFAPAEPPVKFIKILFFLTNAFPNLIFFAYVTARTINEPSPLNIILQVPYYWLKGDLETVHYLCSTQKVCWFEESKSEQIENIADLPNLILVASNVILFVITLVILCRINRPGSTRPDTSPCAYFKAAGTLLFLYGGHYFFLAYRPESESCSVDTFMFYAFICIDVVQGIAISIVFCYMTQEGKTVIAKYWRTRQRFLLIRQFTWMGCLKDRDKFAENGYHHSSLHANNRFNQSTRSNVSSCNGHNENVTEFINMNDTQVSGHF